MEWLTFCIFAVTMKLTDNVDARCWVNDLETLKCLFLGGWLDMDSGEYREFEISAYKNDLYSLIKFYDSSNIDFNVTFNGLGFDAQVLEFIRDNYNKWADLTSLQICGEIYKFVQNLIEDQKYNVRLSYYESQLSVDQLDCYTIGGWDNEQRRMGLKGAEFALDMHSVEEMPIHHSTSKLTREQIRMVASYMRNDIEATRILFLLLLGQTEHPHYQGNNQVELRFNIREEFDMPCLNYSDIKLGEELMKRNYATAVKKKVNELPRTGTIRKSIKVSDCIPSYVTFKTEQFNKLLADLRKQKITQIDKFEKVINFRGRQYTLAKGGLHADQKNEIWRAQEGWLIEDDDVASYYPRIVINNQYYPAHLGEELLKTYNQIYERRVAMKPQAKKDKKIKGIVEAFKLCLNCIFGKMGAKDKGWLYDMKALFSITITGELSLLMLIEMFELNGINVISANSDGVTTMFPESRKEIKDAIVKEWQQITNFEIETVRFKALYYRDVNNYLGIKEDGEIKKKGIFVTDPELHKNKSMRIRALALEQYFAHGKDPVEFIRNHRNVYDFCIRSKAQRDNDNYLELEYDDGTREDVGKLVRYYLSSKENAPQMYKKGTGSTGKKMNVNQAAENDLGTRRVQYFNQYEAMDNYELDTNQYIYETLRVIAQIEKNRKHEDFLRQCIPSNQLSLI